MSVEGNSWNLLYGLDMRFRFFYLFIYLLKKFIFFTTWLTIRSREVGQNENGTSCRERTSDTGIRLEQSCLFYWSCSFVRSIAIYVKWLDSTFNMTFVSSIRLTLLILCCSSLCHVVEGHEGFSKGEQTTELKNNGVRMKHFHFVSQTHSWNDVFALW